MGWDDPTIQRRARKMADCDRHDPDYTCPGKHEWPELVGKSAEEAKAVIQSENPHVDRILVVKYPDIAPPDFCCNRVYLWVDAVPNGKVLFTPMTA